MALKNVSYIISLLLLFCSCEPPGKIVKGALPFFDLKSYFTKEMEQVSGFVKGRKTISIDGEKEVKKLDSIDLKNDLSAFIESDINKPTWYDKYTIDSVFNAEKKLLSIGYNAKSELLRTQKIEIKYEEEAIAGIFIENRKNNFLDKSRQILEYIPGKGYAIKLEQKIIFNPEHEIVIRLDL